MVSKFKVEVKRFQVYIAGTKTANKRIAVLFTVPCKVITFVEPLATFSISLKVYFDMRTYLWTDLHSIQPVSYTHLFDIEEESRSKKEVFKRIKRIRKNAPQHVA